MFTYDIKNVVHETEKGWILKTKTGFEVYEIGATCSTRRATIGFTGIDGYNLAKHWLEKI